MAQIKSFIFYQEWEELFKILTPQERSDLIMAIFEYARDYTMPKNLSPSAKVAFISIKNIISANWAKFVARSNGDYE